MRLRKKKQDITLSMHVITQDNYEGMLRLLGHTVGYFDNIRVCEADDKCKSWELYNKFGCDVVYSAWQDDMSIQHNELLDKAKEGEWIFIMDDDECPTPQLLKKLRCYAEASNNGESYKSCKIASIVDIDGVMNHTIREFIKNVKNNDEQFRKECFFLYDGLIVYTGTSHYELLCDDKRESSVWNKFDISEPYIHYKIPEDYARCDIQQAFIDPSMQDISDDDAIKFRLLWDNAGVKSSRDMLDYLNNGDISKDLKDFFVLHRFPAKSKIFRYFQYYFLFHHPLELNDYSNIIDNIEIDACVLHHLRELGGHKSYARWMTLNGVDGEWLPIGHLDIHEDLKAMLNVSYVMLRVEE